MKSLPHQWLKILFIALLSALLFGVFKMWQIKCYLIDTPIQKKQLLHFPPRSSAKTLVSILEAKHLLKNKYALLAILKLKHVSLYLKSGTYLLEPQDTIWDVVEKIMRGEVYKVPFKIIEGTRLCELMARLNTSPHYTFSPAMLGSIANESKSLEGMLFPSTYLQPYGESVYPILKLAYDTMQKKLAEVWQTRDYNLPYQSAYELLTAASIIEKEASDEQERRLISGVIVNRLKLHMPLQMDPTVIYGMGGCQHILLKGSDLKQDSPYNSYLHRGLPPTPIAMVSMSSLLAAAHPISTSYLYFVAKGDGHHVFSVDYPHQKQAVNYFLRKPHE